MHALPDATTEPVQRTLNPVKRADARGLHSYVVNYLGAAIAGRELAAGTQIVPEEIGARLGVSRTVVREALRVLEAKNLVHARPRLGTRVRPTEEWNLLDEEVIAWRIDGPDRHVQLRELMDLRTGIESVAVRGCCGSATGDDIADLAAACEAMEQARHSEDTAAFTDADVRFHTALLAASGNAMFRRLTPPVQAVLQAREHLGLMPEHLTQNTVANHRAILDAIRDRDPDRAEALSRALMQTARDEFLS